MASTWYEKNDITSLMVSRDTRELLKGLGRKGESYDLIIRRIVQENCEVGD